MQLTLLIGGLTLAALAGTGWYAGAIAIERQQEIGSRMLQATAESAATLLSQALADRAEEIDLLSRSYLFTHGDLSGEDVRDALEDRQRFNHEYAWLGVAQMDARVAQSAGGVLKGASVVQRPWFQASSKGEFYAGDVHEAVLLARALKAADTDQPLRFIDFSAPIYAPDGQLRGVVAGHAHWNWVTETLVNATVGRLKLPGVEMLIAKRDGTLLYPQALTGQVGLPSRTHAANAQRQRWPDGKEYLSAFVDMPPVRGLSWTIVLRQPIDDALRDGAQLRNRLLLGGVLAALAVAILCYGLSVRFSRPLERLAVAARQFSKHRDVAGIPRLENTPELRRLSSAVIDMTQALLQTEAELIATNQGLESTVAARTAELRAANEELARQATLDGLTGVQNRRSLDARLRELFVAFRRSKRPYWVVLLDVDHFKSVNDSYGHQVGDDVLREVARLAAHTLRETDFLARYGGEEFLLLLTDIQDLASARAKAEKIRAAIEDAQIPVAGRVTASLGLSRVHADDASEADAVKRADEALYAAKSGGRNQVQVSVED